MFRTEELTVKNVKVRAQDLLSKVYFNQELDLPIEKQSKLVENLLLGMSTDKSLFIEDHKGDLEIIKADSFYSFVNFLNGEFRLSNLEFLKHLNNLDFDTILRNINSNIAAITVDCVILSPSHEEIRKKIIGKKK